jgi:hypothetical protein
MFDSVQGYDIKFIQRDVCRDKSDHLFSYIYKFRSPKTHLIYILRAEYHKSDIFVLKFYAKQHRHSDLKYSKIINRGDVGNILYTCVTIIPVLLEDFPEASFGFAGAISVEKSIKKSGELIAESLSNNQRFRLYKRLIALVIGEETFCHYDYEEYSAYLMVNRNAGVVEDKEMEIRKVLCNTYSNLPDIYL